MKKNIIILFLTFTFNAFTQIPTAGLMGYWSFTGNASDNSGNNNNGIVTGAALTVDRFGNANSAYDFNGASYIKVNNSSSLNAKNGITISAWFKTTDPHVVSTSGILISKSKTSSSRSYYIDFIDKTNGGGDSLLFTEFDSNDKLYRSTLFSSYYDNNWHLLTTTYDSISGNIKIYVDGTLKTSKQIGHIQFEQNTVPLTIGCSDFDNGYNNYFNGSLDDIRIYDRAISDCEVTALFTESNYKLSGPLFYYPFNGNTNDESGNGNTCTNSGATLTTDRFGNANSAYEFDGSTSFMEITPASIELKNMTDFSLSMWMKKEGWPLATGLHPNGTNRQYLFCGHTGDKTAPTNTALYKQGLSLAIDYNNNTNTKSFYEYLMESYTPIVSNDTTVNFAISETWNHIVYSRKGTVTYLYYNNNLIAVKDSMDANISDMFHQLYIGTSNGNNPNFYFTDYGFQGAIDDIRLYNRAISDCEVTSLYNDGVLPILPLTINIESITNELNGNDGAIDISVSGGNIPYYYSWSNGTSNEDITNLSAGNYTITITDATNKSIIETFTIKPKVNFLSIKGSVISNAGVFNEGIVVLFKQYQNYIYAYSYETIKIDGTYLFDSLSEGIYTLQVIPKNGMSSKYISSYFYNEYNWENANKIDLNGQAINVIIMVKEAKAFTFNGKCSITGTIHSDDSTYYGIFKNSLKSTGLTAPNIVVNLMQNGNIIASTLTNDLGEYTFSNIPIGTYQISVEHAGYTSTKTTVNVSAIDTKIESIAISLEKEIVTYNFDDKQKAFIIYPNPAHYILNLEETFENIQIISVLGIVLIQQSNASSVNISELKSGMYFIKTTNQHKTSSHSFIKD
jgi:hypothetical protein